MGALTATELAPARVRPIEDRSHLRSLVPYVLAQVRRHGLAGHPATDPGSCFQDLVGARVVTGLRVAEALAEALPRFRLRTAHEAVGLPQEPLRPTTLERVREVGAFVLARAAAAAFALPAPMAARSRLASQARAAACALGSAAGIPTDHLADALGVGRGAVRHLNRRTITPGQRDAVLLQLALQAAVAGVGKSES